jgi:hypothetical protein
VDCPDSAVAEALLYQVSAVVSRLIYPQVSTSLARNNSTLEEGLKKWQ